MNSSDASSNSDQSNKRETARRARIALSDREREFASDKIAAHVCEADFFLDAQSVGIYVSLKSEVNTWPIIQRAWEQKKRIFAPVTYSNSSMRFRNFASENELEVNNLGLREPRNGRSIELSQLDLVLAPVVAFDINGNRIGMGGGFYDRAFQFLKNGSERQKPLLVGLAFDCQKVEKIATNPWDIRLLRVVTESGET